MKCGCRIIEDFHLQWGYVTTDECTEGHKDWGWGATP